MRNFSHIVVLYVLSFVSVCLYPQAILLGKSDPSQQHLYGKSYAVVIGIDQYKSPNWPKLDYAVKDAMAMAAYLARQGFEVIQLYDKDATKEAILSKLQDDLKHRVQREDRVVFFFSGHGFTETVAGKDWGYIIPYDGKTTVTYIGMEDLQTVSEKLGAAKHQLFILDSCFGGLLGTRSGGVDPNVPNYITDITRRKARQVLTAGGKDQKVPDKGPDGHSNFVGCLLKALEKGDANLNADGFITFPELITYILSCASSRFATPARGALPSGDECGEFVFTAPQGMRVVSQPPAETTGTTKGPNIPAPVVPQDMVHAPTGWLGVVIQDITPDLAKSFNITHTEGVFVSDIQDNSLAEEAGIERGDIVVEYDGKPIRDVNHLRNVVAQTEVGKKVKVKVLRKGKGKKLMVKIDKQPAEVLAAGQNGVAQSVEPNRETSGKEESRPQEKQSYVQTNQKRPLQLRFDFPRDYKNWTHGTSNIVLDKESPLYGFQQVFVNDIALDAYKRGGGYPEGSMLVIGFYEAIEEGDEVKQGNIIWYAAMKKDSRAQKTSGWIFDGFDGKTYQSGIDDPVAGCYNCHISKKDWEYVFTSFAGDISVPEGTELAVKPGSFGFPADLRSWRHSNSKVILDEKNPLYGFQQIYVNDIGFKANQSGETYPDGSHITVGFYEPIVDGKTISQGNIIWYASMKKDSKAAPKTGGWIMDGFDGKKLNSVIYDPVAGCFNCHLIKESNDYVFSKYVP